MTVRKTTFQKNTQKSIQTYRFYSQVLFILICVWIGIHFHLFVNAIADGTASNLTTRPPGVEAFLPISALMSFLYFLYTGSIHTVHPAGFFMFIGFLALSFVAGKSFCSWVCPVGFISEMTGEFGKKILPKNWHMPKWMDIPLRSLKYLLLLFFLQAIVTMTVVELKVFLDSDYNIIADIKMYEFFKYLSRTSVIVLSSLLFLSVLFNGFWCRYLCPYGALLGIVGLLSPIKIRRNKASCIDCGLCDKVCPSRIAVSKVRTVVSDECTSCSSCIDACPVTDTLSFTMYPQKRQIHKGKLFLTAGIIYFLIISAGFALGKWHNSVSLEKYKVLYQTKDSVNH